MASPDRDSVIELLLVAEVSGSRRICEVRAIITGCILKGDTGNLKASLEQTVERLQGVPASKSPPDDGVLCARVQTSSFPLVGVEATELVAWTREYRELLSSVDL